MQEKSNEETFAVKNAGTVFFLGVSAVIFFILYFSYEKLLVDTQLFGHYLELCTQLASQLLTAISVEHQWIYGTEDLKTRLADGELGAFIDITKHSDASMICAVLIACIAAWPGNIVKKLGAVVLGVAIILALNIVRIAAMLVVDIYAPLHFELYSTMILPGILIAAAVGYFIFWIIISGTHPSD